MRAAGAGGDPAVLDMASAVLGEVRRAKTAAQVSMRADVAHLVVRDTAERLVALSAALTDVAEAGRVGGTSTEEATAFSVDVALAPVAEKNT